MICFALLGVALSHLIPNPESAPAYVNAVFLPQILIAGVFYDADEAPNIIHDIAQALPLTHLVDGLSGAIVDNQGLSHHWVALLVLALVGGGRRRARCAGFFLGSPQRGLSGFARGPPQTDRVSVQYSRQPRSTVAGTIDLSGEGWQLAYTVGHASVGR